MVVKKVKRHLEINLDFLKLKLRSLRKSFHCPLCNQKMSKVKTFAICNKCDYDFSKLSDREKKEITERIRHVLDPIHCSLCEEKDLEMDNKLYFCPECKITFHR